MVKNLERSGSRVKQMKIVENYRDRRVSCSRRLRHKFKFLQHDILRSGGYANKCGRFRPTCHLHVDTEPFAHAVTGTRVAHTRAIKR